MKHQISKILSFLLVAAMVCNVCLAGAVFAEGKVNSAGAEVTAGVGDSGQTTDSSEAAATPQPTAEPSAEPSEQLKTPAMAELKAASSPGPHMITVNVKGADTAAAIENATVVIYPEGSSPEGEDAVAAGHVENGDYTAAGFHNGDYCIAASAPGYLDLAEHKKVTLQGGSMISIREEIILIKDTRVTYSGVVTDARQIPVVGMSISAAKAPESQNGVCDQASGITDEEGRFEFILDSSADYTVSFSQHGKLYRSETVSRPAQTRDANYTLEGFYLTSVALTDAVGGPAVMETNEQMGIRSFVVSVSGIPNAIQTDGQAVFQFLGTAQQTNILVYSQGQFFEKQMTIPDCSVQEEPFRLTLDEISLNLVVKDGEGNPVELINYKVINDNIDEGHTLIYEKSARSEDGIFELNCLDASAGKIQLFVSAEGYAPAEQQIKLKQTGPLDDVEAVLLRGTVTVSVVNVEGSPVSNCTLITDAPDIKISSASSAFKMTNVPVGTEFSISISNSKYETQVFHTLVADEEERALTCYMTTPTSSVFGKLSGKVTSQAEQPIEGALVKLGERFVYTDKNGNYNIDRIPLNQAYDLKAIKEGYVSKVYAQDVVFDTQNQTRQHNLVMPEATDVSVLVNDEATGLPIANVRLTAGGMEDEIISHGDGKYTLRGIPADVEKIAVSAPGYLTQTVTVEGLQNGSVALKAANQADTKTMEGYVRDQWGNVLANATVSVDGQTTLTDAAGYYIFYCVTGREIQISAEKAGYQSNRVSSTETYAEVLLKTTEPANGRIDGVVTDASGDPIDNAQAEIYYVDGRGYSQTVYSINTTSNGIFSIGSLVAGREYHLRVSKEGKNTYEAIVKSDNSATKYIKLLPAGTYTVTVKKPEGQPAQGVRCYVPGLDRYFVTDEAGVAVIDGLLYGTSYDIYVEAAGYMPSMKSGIRTSDTASNLTGTTILSVVPDGKATLNGTVTDFNTGAPVAGAIVMCSAASLRTFTDENGRYSLPGLPKGAQLSTINVSKSSFEPNSEKIALVDAENTLNLTLERLTGKISGVVLDSNGSPLSGVYVDVSGSNTVTLGDGSYELNGVSVRNATTTVSYTKMGYQTQTLHVSLSKTKTEDIMPPAVLKKIHSAVIHLQDAKNGSVVTDATVDLVSTDSSTKYRMTASGDAFKYEQIPAGNYMVSIVSGSYYSPSTVPIINVPANIPCTIRLEPRPKTNTGGGGGGGGGGGYFPPAVATATPQPTAIPTAGPTAPPEWQGFQDMNNSGLSWAVTPVYELVDAGVIAKADYYRPDDNITREEFIKMLVEAFDFYIPNAVSNFTDAAEGDWYYTYVASAAQVGILNGYDDGSFGAGQQISRQDMAVLSYRAALLSGRDIPVLKEAEVFIDQSQISEYAREAVASMQCAGIINGMGDGTFAPQSNATRAQAAKIMYGLWTLPVL